MEDQPAELDRRTMIDQTRLAHNAWERSVIAGIALTAIHGFASAEVYAYEGLNWLLAYPSLFIILSTGFTAFAGKKLDEQHKHMDWHGISHADFRNSGS